MITLSQRREAEIARIRPYKTLSDAELSVMTPSIATEREAIDRLLISGKIDWDEFLNRAGQINKKYLGVEDSIMLTRPYKTVAAAVLWTAGTIFQILGWAIRAAALVLLVGIPLLILAAVIKWAWLIVAK